MSLRAARSWQALLRKLTLAAIAVSLFLALLEAGSRVVGTFAGPTQPLQVGSIQLYGRHDPLLFWSLRPGAEAPDGTRWVNDKGLRGPEIGRKQSDEYRILSLGESTTFAAQLAYSDSYSAVLESLQNERRLDTRVRVLNAGVPGYSLFQGIVYLKSRAKRLGIDLVLVYFGYNDFLPVAYLSERAGRSELSNAGLNDWQLYSQRRTLGSRAVNLLLRRSNLFRGLMQATAPEPGDLRTLPNRPRVPAEHRAQLLDIAYEFCREEGIELVIVVPIYGSFDEHAVILRSFATGRGVTLVDLPKILPPRFTKPRNAYFLDAVHPTAEGHRLIALAIHEAISSGVK